MDESSTTSRLAQSHVQRTKLYEMKEGSYIRQRKKGKGKQYEKSLSSQSTEKFRSYVTWNKAMDKALAEVLLDQMAKGNKSDGDSWKPQVLQAAVEHVKSELDIDLSKDNVKNHLKLWKKYYAVVTDIIKKQSGFVWDKERNMIVVTASDIKEWNVYVKSNPDAKGMQNKAIENWEDIVLLCEKDRATGEGIETFDEGAETMVEEGEFEVISPNQTKAATSTSPEIKSQDKKRGRRDALADAITDVASSLSGYFEVKKKKEEEQPTILDIHTVVFEIPGLNDEEVYNLVRKIEAKPGELRLLKSSSGKESGLG